MPIGVGDRAPSFKLPAKMGEEVDVGALLGKEKVVLLFVPLAFSSVCTAELCHFKESWRDWTSMGAKVVAVSVDSPFVTDKWRQLEGIPFPVLSDFNKTVVATYGVLLEDLKGLKGVAKRSAFVVGSDGKVTYAAINEDPGKQVDFEAIKAAVARTK